MFFIVYSINSSEYGRNSSISDEDVKVADLKSLLLDKNQLPAAYQSKGKSLDLSQNKLKLIYIEIKLKDDYKERNTLKKKEKSDKVQGNKILILCS